MPRAYGGSAGLLRLNQGSARAEAARSLHSALLGARLHRGRTASRTGRAGACPAGPRARRAAPYRAVAQAAGLGPAAPWPAAPTRARRGGPTRRGDSDAIDPCTAPCVDPAAEMARDRLRRPPFPPSGRVRAHGRLDPSRAAIGSSARHGAPAGAFGRRSPPFVIYPSGPGNIARHHPLIVGRTTGVPPSQAVERDPGPVRPPVPV